MKKILLVVIVAAFAFQANAQIGVKLGYNFAKQTEFIAKQPGFNLDEYKKASQGVLYGGFFDKDLIPLLDIRVGLEYSPKGVKVGRNDDYIQTQINYLELPVLAKVNIGPLYGLGGVYGAYAMNGKFKTNILGVETEQDIKFDDDDARRIDYGLKFGAGIQMGLGPVHAFAQLEYSYGIANVSSIERAESHNSVLTASVGLILGM